jgi:hypothetical protein
LRLRQVNLREIKRFYEQSERGFEWEREREGVEGIREELEGSEKS